MNCALERTHSNTLKITVWEKDSVSRKSLGDNNFKASSNVCKLSSLAWRNSDQKCAVLKFLVLEHNGHWRIATLLLQHPEHRIHLGSGSQVKMDGLHLVSPSPVSSVRADQQKGRRGPTSERGSSIKPFTATRFAESNTQSQSRNKGFPNKVSRCNILPADSSCQTSFSSSDSSVNIPTGSNASNASDTHIAISKIEESTKRNPKKKARKKANRNKRPGLTNLECVRGSSTFETGFTKNTDYVIASLPYATRLAVLSPQTNGSGSNLEGNSSGNIIFSESPKLCTSYIDEGDVLEVKLIGEHCSPTENGVVADFPEFSIIGGVQDRNSNPTSCSTDPCSSGYSQTNDSSMSDSISFCSNDKKHVYASYKVSAKGNGRTKFSRPSGYIARNGLYFLPNVFSGVGDSYCHMEGTSSSEHGCSRSDVARRVEQIKNMPRNPSISCLSSSGKFIGCSGKENSHPVWQKVQRNDTRECSSGLRKVKSDNSESGGGLKEVPLLKKKSNGAKSCMLSTREGKNHSKLKSSRKSRRKSNLGSKDDVDNYSTKGSYPAKASSTVCSEINVQQSEVVDISAQSGGKNGLNRTKGSCSISCKRIGFLTNGVESSTSEAVRNLEDCPGELQPFEHICATLSILNEQTAKIESNSLSGSCDDPDQTEFVEGQSTGYLNPRGGEGTNVSKDVSHLEHNKQEHTCESTLRKWKPIGIKGYVVSRSGHSSSLPLAHSREIGSDCDHSSSINASLMCSGQGAIDRIGLHSEGEVQIEKHSSQRTCTPNESSVNQVAAKCFSTNPRDHNCSAVENESNKIAQAINDAYRAQLASEAVQMATGCPIAEFEKLLSSASPVISLPYSISICQNCLPDEIIGAPLCRHEMPNVTLGSLWQWYEKHGTYGLEVRAKDYDNSKRLGIDRVAFRAYFVPFLSAVQLFRNSKSPSDTSSTASGKDAVEEACTFDIRPGNSSNVSCLPIYSLLFPQPHMDTSSLSPMNSVCCTEMSSVAAEVNEAIQSDDSTSTDELELLFEYFEVEQPQKRRTLFEMIKELVKGIFRYSVAWYPIYRIPDDNFRAAFLTYHSLGHFVRQSVASDSFGAGACAVSPVVGLQSYNAQWSDGGGGGGGGVMSIEWWRWSDGCAMVVVVAAWRWWRIDGDGGGVVAVVMEWRWWRGGGGGLMVMVVKW
ncbi:hypothetical protein RHMOL_Rhmol08G0149400 [Rhododendron molle]|uniref:Uncharacterized protein n=1 Tax=Rhododendron molle TaxID=49168 RepID=A0ACC0MPV1_RHOML|nr:hypothetical protein RHMOL_Rhmol08G0149400 [Rhododendron molle]